MTHNFFVSLTPRERGFRWTVTCERCNTDLSGEFDDAPLVVVKVPNLAELMATNPELVQRRIKALERARSLNRILVVDIEERIEQTPGWNLQRMLAEHATRCQRT